MEVGQVQQWVMSALLATVAFIFAGGVEVLSATSVQEGARPGLLSISVIVGLAALWESG